MNEVVPVFIHWSNVRTFEELTECLKVQPSLYAEPMAPFIPRNEWVPRIEQLGGNHGLHI